MTGSCFAEIKITSFICLRPHYIDGGLAGWLKQTLTATPTPAPLQTQHSCFPGHCLHCFWMHPSRPLPLTAPTQSCVLSDWRDARSPLISLWHQLEWLGKDQSCPKSTSICVGLGQTSARDPHSTFLLKLLPHPVAGVACRAPTSKQTESLHVRIVPVSMSELFQGIQPKTLGFRNGPTGNL